jgi:hypothetical protein
MRGVKPPIGRLLCGLALFLAAPALGGELEEIRAKIQILNLLNGLELRYDQMRLVLDAARKAQKVEERAKASVSEKEARLAAVLKEILANAEAGSVVVPPEIKQRLHAINQEMDKVKDSSHDEIGRLARTVRDALAPHQIVILNDYKACIVPPAAKGRVGQADDASGFARLLARVHDMPAARYERKRAEIAAREADKAASKTPPGTILDKNALQAKLLSAMDEVRAVPDVEFGVKKDEIAKRIEARLHPSKPPVNIGVKIDRFLLRPEIIPLLEKRLASGR